jgi:hypothetical protein
MNPDLGADGSSLLGLPEGSDLLAAARLQSGPGTAFFGPKCRVFPWHLGAVLLSVALERMTVGYLMLARAAASAAALQSATFLLGPLRR